MRSKATLAGEMTDGDTPVWEPLLDLAPELIDDFMWMFEVALEDGRRLQAYKHIDTRRYLHLDPDGRVYVFTDDERYREEELWWILFLVLRPLWEEHSVPQEQVEASRKVVERARERR